MNAVTVRVEATAGSRFTPEDSFAPSRVLTGWPVGEGYVENSLTEDGEPAKALVLLNEPALPGTAVAARPVALARLVVDGEPRETVVCVAEKAADFDAITGVRELRAWHADEAALGEMLLRFGPGHSWQVTGYEGCPAVDEFLARARLGYERLTGSLE